ncbi:MAG: OmpA family protein [Pseudomonadota bacterium]
MRAMQAVAVLSWCWVPTIVLAQEVEASDDAATAQPSSRDEATEGAVPGGKVVAVEGDSPGYKDIRVSDRAPNMAGQTGLWRVTSARTGEGGYFDIGLHGRYFYGENFIVDGSTDQAAYGVLSFGFTFNDYIELAVSGLMSANENSAVRPRTTFSSGDAAANLKLAVPVWLFAFGVDARAFFPSGRDRIGPELDNFGAQVLALATLDLWADRGIPFRLHLNGGYIYQNRGAGQDRLLTGNLGHLLALTFEYTWYDRATYGLGVEVPLPYVTPFLELTGEFPIADGIGFTDAPLRITPGIRVTPGRGLAFDLGADIRVLGGSRAIAGLATPTPWMVHAGLSYTFSPFVAETRVEIQEVEKRVEVERAVGFVGGQVIEAGTRKPIPQAVVTFVDRDGPRIVADAQGRYRSYGLNPGPVQVAANHPAYRSAQGDTVIAVRETAALDIELVADPKVGVLKGVIVDEQDRSVAATMEIIDDSNVSKTLDQPGGSYRVELSPGRHQVVIKAEGYLQQGRMVVVEKSGQTVEDFVLKKEPKKRVTILRTDRIEIKSTIHFEFNKARILANSYHILDEVVDIMLKNPQVKKVRVEGHTDNVGDDTYNKRLSESRAKAVIDYLIEHGVEDGRLFGVGYGEEKPISTNQTEKGRAQNRRVEFNIVDEPDSGGAASSENSGADDGLPDAEDDETPPPPIEDL